MKPPKIISESDFLAPPLPAGPGSVLALTEELYPVVGKFHLLLGLRVWRVQGEGKYQFYPVGLTTAPWLWREAVGHIEQLAREEGEPGEPVSIRKSLDDELRIARQTYKGRENIAARVWKIAPTMAYPQRNGINLTASTWLQLLPAVREVLKGFA